MLVGTMDNRSIKLPFGRGCGKWCKMEVTTNFQLIQTEPNKTDADRFHQLRTIAELVGAIRLWFADFR